MARFPQLDRLADYEQWSDWQERRPNTRRRKLPVDRRSIPLDEIITPDGVYDKDDC